MSDRPTTPPSADESAKLAAFEEQIKSEGEGRTRWARVLELARQLFERKEEA